MRKSVALLATLLLAAAPSVALAKSKSKSHHHVSHQAKVATVEHHPSFVGDALSQIFVPVESIAHASAPAKISAKTNVSRHSHRVRSKSKKTKGNKA